MSAVWVKICGITRLEDAVCAARFGADAVGFIFAESPRRLTPEAAREISRRMPDGPARVGVFADTPLGEVREVTDYCGLDMVQLHGGEDPDYCSQISGSAIKAFRVNGGLEVARANGYPCYAVLFDFRCRKDGGLDAGGMAMLRLLEGKCKVILAGGLNEENVAEAIRAAHPYGVDVSSGIESSPGVKDPVRMYRFIERARRAAYDLRG